MTNRLNKTLRALAITPSKRLLLFVGILASVVTVGTLVAKVQKFLRLGPDAGVLDAAATLSSDVFIVAAWIVGWTWALHLARGRWSTALAALFQFMTMIILLFLVVEHGFYLATGSLLDWHLLRYTAEHLGQLKLVIASEMGAASWLGLGAAVVVAITPALLLRGRAWQRPEGPPLAGRIVTLVAASLIVLGLAHASLSLHKLPAKLQLLRSNAAAAHVGDGLADLLGTSEGGSEDTVFKPVEPVVVTRTNETKPYNVVMIVLESVRADVLTPYNPDLKTAPFLGELAAKGTLAEQAYTVIPHTTKSLVPLHCGIYPKITPRFHEATDGGMPVDCLARLLGRFGYATHFIQSPESVFERRRDLVKAFGFERLSAKEDLPSEGFQHVGYFGYEDDVMLQPTFDWLDQQQGKPFYLGLLNATSHHPYEVPKNFEKRKWDVGAKMSRYFDSLRYTDRFIKKLFAGFEARGLMKNTIFVIAGDHGEGFNEHGRYGHDDSIHEEGMRVPLFLVGADVPAGVRLKGLWQHIDVMPTVLELLKLRVVAGDLPGRSLLKGEGHKRLFYSCWRDKRCLAMREGDTKIIYHYGKRDPEVYDLAADPGEKDDLLAAGKVTVDSLAPQIAAMEDWRKEVNGRFQAQSERRKSPWISDSAPADIGTPVDITFDSFARMIGYKVETNKLKDGDATWVTCVYEVLRPPKPGWNLWMHAAGPREKGKVKLFNSDHVPVEGSYPVDKWQAGQFITDRHWLRMPPGYPSGDYELTVGFYRRDGNKRAWPHGEGLSITASGGAHLGTLHVTNPRAPAKTPLASLLAKDRALVSLEAPSPLPGGATATFADLLALEGVTQGTRRVLAGKSISFTWHLAVLQETPRWTDIFVHVEGPLTADGKGYIDGKRSYINAVHRSLPGGPDIGKWPKGWHVKDHHAIHVPKHFRPGRYRVLLGFWDPNRDSPEHRLEPTSRAPVIKDRVLVGEFNVARPGSERPATP